jgi:medium-chain acyl-[acyl-carrier-protein] hydrolase
MLSLTEHVPNTIGIWFRRDHTPMRIDLRLFCFPYAGGGALVYRDWADHLPSTVQVIPVELPGRGARLKEPPFLSLPPLIDALAELIIPLLDVPFCFFGHSMGALIAFELTRRLHRQYGVNPQLLFVSGRRPPQIPDSDPATYDLPNDEFIAELQRINGISKEVLEHRELMEIFTPLLRADFRLTQTYEYIDGMLIQCPIIAYGGLDDPDVTRDLLSQWEAQTASKFAIHMLPGDHFFLRSSQNLLLGLLTRELNKLITPPSLI